MGWPWLGLGDRADVCAVPRAYGGGELTRGSGMTEHQRAVWTMSAIVSSPYNYAMQEFFETVYTTSDQHKDASAPRMARDKEDLAKLAAKLDQQSPFSDEVTLRNIITGINADTNVNVQNLFHRGQRRGDEHGRASCALVFAQTHQCSEDTNINQIRHSR